MYIDTPITKAIKAKIASAKSLDQISYINFSGFKMTVIPNEARELLQKCTNLYEINFSGCGLQSLDNLPNLALTILILQNNELRDSELQKLAIYKNSLEILTLSRNNLQSISHLGFFRSFTRLSQINLKQNPLCNQYVSYSRKIFEQILYKNEQLTIIDKYLRSGEILSEDEDDGLDIDELMIEQEQSNRSGNQGQSEEQKSIESDDNGFQKIDTAVMSLYHQYSYSDPSLMVELMNENQMGLLQDPYMNAMDEDYMDIEKQVEAEGGKCIVAKKIKYEVKNDDDDMDY